MMKITVLDVEYLAHRLATEMMEYDEPIPAFSTRKPNVLESCLAQPFITWDKKSLYPTLISKASILFYLMIKNHPFENGNKRIAMTTTMVFLSMNSKWLKIDKCKLYDFTVWVAESLPETKDGVVLAIEKLFKKYTIDYRE